MNEDINAELDFEICKQLSFGPYSEVVGWKTITTYNSFLVHIFEGFDLFMLFYDHFRLIKTLKAGFHHSSFAIIENSGGELPIRRNLNEMAELERILQFFLKNSKVVYTVSTPIEPQS